EEGEPPAPGADILYVETVIVILFGQQIGPPALLMAQEFGQGFDSGLFRSKAQLTCRPFTGHCPVVLNGVAFGSAGKGNAGGSGGAKQLGEGNGALAAGVEN